MRRCVVFAVGLLSVVVVACGGPPEPSAPAAPTTPPPASTASPAAAAGGDADCFGAFSKKRPAGWTEVGKLVIAVKDELPVGYEVLDAKGTKVDAGAVTVKGARAASDLLAQKGCKVGGVLAIYEAKADKDGSLTAVLVKPPREDEPGDVAALCAAPAEIPADFDDAQRRRAAVDVFEERLTSRKWRGWLFDMAAKLRKSDDAGRPAVMKAKADELDAAAKSKDCWFSNTLRKQR